LGDSAGMTNKSCRTGIVLDVVIVVLTQVPNFFNSASSGFITPLCLLNREMSSFEGFLIVM